MADQFPEKFGKFKIIEEVGRGGFADVYKAIDTTLDRTVALKFLEPRLLREPTFVERFQREAKLAANLKHPSIVFIHEFGWEAGTVYLSMEFLEGRTLKEVILEEGALPPKRIVNIIGQIASALDYAHGRGLVHRDIKPSNIMVGADDQVTVMDFGIAKAATLTALTTTGRIFGTPEYMSPEQAEGLEEPDARSDIYSLGVVVYEMVTGQAPFSGTTPLSIMRGHADKPPPRPSEVNPAVSPAVEAVLLRTLAKQAVSGATVEEVKAPPGPALHPSLALQLSVKPRMVNAGGEAQWTVTLRNDGDDDLRHVTVRRGWTLLDEPFDLAAGEGRRFAFTTTYKTEGREIEKVTATGIASTGQSVRDEARATVEVTPTPLEPEVLVPRAPKAVPKKTLGVGALLAGGLVLLCIVGIVIVVISIGPWPTPTPEVVEREVEVTKVVEVEKEVEVTKVVEVEKEVTPTPSPQLRDGGVLAYICDSDICLANESGEVIDVFSTGYETWPSWMSWSPDGTRLLFGIELDGPNEVDSIELFTLDTRTGELLRLTNNSSGDLFPVWSPDGIQVAFVSERNGGRKPFMMNADGSNQRQLSEHGTQDIIWSPDGSLIAFASGDGLYTIKPDGSSETLLVDGVVDEPSWSPDGKWIAYYGDCAQFPDDCQVFIVEQDGQNKRELIPGTTAYFWIVYWSPDSEYVALQFRFGDEDYEVFVVNRDGSNLRNVSNDPGEDLLQGWSPDGEWVMFSSIRNEIRGTYIVRPDGSDLQLLTSESFYVEWTGKSR